MGLERVGARLPKGLHLLAKCPHFLAVARRVVHCGLIGDSDDISGILDVGGRIDNLLANPLQKGGDHGGHALGLTFEPVDHDTQLTLVDQGYVRYQLTFYYFGFFIFWCHLILLKKFLTLCIQVVFVGKSLNQSSTSKISLTLSGANMNTTW